MKSASKDEEEEKIRNFLEDCVLEAAVVTTDERTDDGENTDAEDRIRTNN